MMSSNEITILFGSQTGQAESIAAQIHEEACFKNYDAKIYCLKDEGKLFHVNELSCAIIVCSTTGDGDPPENARKFIRTLRQKQNNPSDKFLKHFYYALLGLGDTNYSTFCGGPKKLESALQKCGATRFYSTAYADDATDMADTIEPWLDGLWAAVGIHYKALEQVATKDSCLTSSNPDNTHSENCTSFCETVTHINKNGKTGDALRIASSSVTLDNASLTKSTKELTMVNHVKSTDACAITQVLHLEKLSVSDILAAAEDVTKAMHQTLHAPNLLQLDTGPSDLMSSLVCNGNNLTLPPALPHYLEIEIRNGPPSQEDVSGYQNNFPFPMACGCSIVAHVTSMKQLTTAGALKQALEVQLESNEMFAYQPGDSFAICCENDEAEVVWLIERLNLREVADKSATLKVRSNTAKKNANVPKFIPQPFTIRQALTSCLEIRSVPKKPFLRALVDCTSDVSERQRLEELCSRQGANTYTQHVRESALCILDILSIFPSCLPTFALLAQFLPRLQARRYSVANSPLASPHKLRFVFTVVNLEKAHGRRFQREGVCTGALRKMYDRMLESKRECAGNETLRIFPTKSNEFRLPDDPSTPLVMIGPGTGIAPFIGFLEHRESLNTSASVSLGESWLFYGCRFRDRDYLYESQLQSFHQNGVLNHLEVAFSREQHQDGEIKYVQHLLKLQADVVAELLLNTSAIFYVCGDARNMAKDVRRCMLDVLAHATGCSEESAAETFSDICARKRYKEDIWT